MRIAYLEDDHAQAELVTHWLREAGHTCMHLSSGREFMSLLRRDTFDLLVLDWEVPDMSGYAVLGEVRASVFAIISGSIFSTMCSSPPTTRGGGSSTPTRPGRRTARASRS